jgi:hypothetical protein
MLMRTVAAVGIAVALIACTAVPIYNVQGTPIATASGKKPTTAQVRGAILASGAGLGWTMKDAQPGVIEARLALRSHVAVIEIPYSDSSYSIVYKSSTGLDESGGNIHKNYNGWIQNLQRSINAQVSALN